MPSEYDMLFPKSGVFEMECKEGQSRAHSGVGVEDALRNIAVTRR